MTKYNIQNVFYHLFALIDTLGMVDVRDWVIETLALSRTTEKVSSNSRENLVICSI